MEKNFHLKPFLSTSPLSKRVKIIISETRHILKANRSLRVCVLLPPSLFQPQCGNALKLRHTPPLSHAAILHNSNSAFILNLSTPNLSFHPSFLHPPGNLFSFSSPHQKPSIFSVLTFIRAPHFSSLPSPSTLFHLPVQMAIFLLRACRSLCLQSQRFQQPTHDGGERIK